MPGTGTPFNSFILPYSIRVDAFASTPEEPLNPYQPTQPKLHLLTHTHSDHITGLQAKSFAQIIRCSVDAKSMLLRHQIGAERALTSAGVRAEIRRTYAHLKVDPLTGPSGEVFYKGSRDLLQPLRVNEPTEVELDASEDGKLTITAFDANHCPGSLMYLIEGSEGAVLHTGDFRAEPWFLESIKRNPFLQPYIACDSWDNSDDEPDKGITRSLEAIYIDTACILQTHRVPTKEHATNGLISLLSLFPSTTKFFINAWTWGYEDILKAISRYFKCRIHLDSYKYDVFKQLKGDPLLSSLGTQDETESRFHSCERFERCSRVAVDDLEVVYINPVSSMTPQGWEAYLEATEKRIRDDPKRVTSLLVPLSRHSPLPELQAFVSLFRPKRVIPNTLEPALKNIDWAAYDCVFEGCLRFPRSNKSKIPPTPQPTTELIREVYKAEKLKRRLKEKERARQRPARNRPSSNDDSESDADEEEDVAIKNIVVASGSPVNESVDDNGCAESPGESRTSTADREREEKKLAKTWVVRTGESTHGEGAKQKSMGRKQGRMERRLGVLFDWLKLDSRDLSLHHERDDGVGSKPNTVDIAMVAGHAGRVHHRDNPLLHESQLLQGTEGTTVGRTNNTSTIATGSARQGVDEVAPGTWSGTVTTRQQLETAAPSSRGIHSRPQLTAPILRLPESPLGHPKSLHNRPGSFLRSSSPIQESQSSELSQLSNESSDDEADERGRTAHYLFFDGEDEDVQQQSSDPFDDSSANIQGHDDKESPHLHNHLGPTTASPKTPSGSTRVGRHRHYLQLTPISSPVARQRTPAPSPLSLLPRDSDRSGSPLPTPPSRTKTVTSFPQTRPLNQKRGRDPSFIDLTTIPSSPATPRVFREISSVNLSKRPATPGASNTPATHPTRRRQAENEPEPTSSRSTKSSSSRDPESGSQGTGMEKERRKTGFLTEVQNFLDNFDSQCEEWDDRATVQKVQSKLEGKGKGKEKAAESSSERQLTRTPTLLLDKTVAETSAIHVTGSAPANSSTRKRKRSPGSQLKSHSTQLAMMNQMAIARPIGQSPSFVAAHAKLEREYAREAQKQAKMKEYEDGMLAMKRRKIEKWGKVCEDLEKTESKGERGTKRHERSERSLMLEEKAKEDVRHGRRVVLPQMRCTMTESQLEEEYE
ncbi:hypothetical protein K435DRAFT_743497 [Dendrothele bispora CBS 962.96]|uniref:Protein artemis n=1 Tax=Dendrothele bispora (strain CBS 962.96) TaxID=1314807 RepID=A0A4V4HIG1_DENBC|nr:hypothetical protein K435DRAFT_743497 [Dendrothele bispora CBS 962.96]